MSHAPWQPTSHPRPNRTQRRWHGQTRRTASVLAGTLVATGVGSVIVAAPAAASISTINADRAGAGLGPLAESAGLDSLAASHSRAMAAAGSLFHTGNLAAAIGSVVPGWTQIGENVGVASSLAEVNAMFMASAEHRANILGSYTVAGLGVATGSDGRVWVTEEFAKTSTTPKIATAVAPAPATSSGMSSVTSTTTASPTRTVLSVPDASFTPPAVPAVVGGFSSGSGYDLIGSDGGVFAFGGGVFSGSLAAQHLNAPVIAGATSPSSAGSWLVASDGGVFALGAAPYLGSLGGKALNAPVDSASATPSGSGYLLVAADGGVFSFGDAPYAGSMAGHAMNAPVVSSAVTPTGQGYVLTASDGGVFTFGDAPFLGSMAGRATSAPIVSLAMTPSGHGYWLAGADGAVYAFGDAPYLGGANTAALNSPIVGLAPTPTGTGYRLIAGDGGVFAYGTATFAGSAAGIPGLRSWSPS